VGRKSCFRRFSSGLKLAPTVLDVADRVRPRVPHGGHTLMLAYAIEPKGGAHGRPLTPALILALPPLAPVLTEVEKGDVVLPSCLRRPR